MNAVVSDLKLQMTAWSARTFGWLIKRELWEHRGRLIITPLVIAGVISFGVLIGAIRVGPALELEGIEVSNMQQAFRSGAQYAIFLGTVAVFAVVMAFVNAYYILDALYAERRDRSVLFWKSLPISDLETVLSKLSIASFVGPLIVTAIAIATALIVMAIVSIVFAVNGRGFGTVWNAVPIGPNAVFALYTTITFSIWMLPAVAWGLLASVWAPRAPLFWAVVPVVAAALLERLAFGTSYVREIINFQLEDYARLAFSHLEGMHNREVASLLEVLNPVGFFTSPSVWIGLIVAAVLIAATVWARRYRDAG